MKVIIAILLILTLGGCAEITTEIKDTIKSEYVGSAVAMPYMVTVIDIKF